jgi:hypothetical protein
VATNRPVVPVPAQLIAGMPSLQLSSPTQLSAGEPADLSTPSLLNAGTLCGAGRPTAQKDYDYVGRERD